MPMTEILPIAFDKSYETVEDQEDETEHAIAKTLLEISDITFADTGLGLRSVHAKSHGLLRGHLVVPSLAPPFAQGLFAKACSYSVVIRLSTSPGDVLDDRISTPRGFAMKVIGVEGPRLPGSEAATTQDFLLVNGPAFLAPSAKKFLGTLKLLAPTTDKAPRLKKAFSALLQGSEKILETFGAESGALKGLGGHPETHLLGETFFSEVPFLYGAHVAKWQIAPVSAELIALKNEPVDLHDKPNGLREAVKHFFATRSAEWELRVQLCTDLERMPLEDSTVAWPEELSPFVTIARITVPAQDAWNEHTSVGIDEGLSFSPWHGLAAHRPLGAINRVRRTAYSNSADARSVRGRCPIHEP